MIKVALRKYIILKIEINLFTQHYYIDMTLVPLFLCFRKGHQMRHCPLDVSVKKRNPNIERIAVAKLRAGL